MSKAGAKAEKRRQKLKKKQQKLMRAGKFRLWRSRRPFWGATLTFLAGLMILYIPVHLYAIAFVPGSFAFVGLFFGGAILLIGAISYFYPQFSTVFGVLAIFLSVLSIMGALGGFIFGTIFGIFGGALLIAWKPDIISSNSDEEWEQKATTIEGGKAEGRKAVDHGNVLEPTGSTRVTYGYSNREIASTDDEGGRMPDQGKHVANETERSSLGGNAGSGKVFFADESGIVGPGSENSTSHPSSNAEPKQEKRPKKEKKSPEDPGDVLNSTASTVIFNGTDKNEKRNA